MSDLQIAGATYPEVPSILIPKVGGGYAEYTEGGGGSTTLTPFVIRPDAELIQSYTDDQWLVADAGIELPAYSTATVTLKASANLTPTITMDYTAYDYYVVERTLAIPAYSADTKVNGREEFCATSYVCDVINISPDLFVASTGETITSRPEGVSGQSFTRLLYWVSATSIALRTDTSYGATMSIYTPTVLSGVLTIKSPRWLIRGSTTCLTSAAWALLTDIRYQYVIDVYRAPKANLNVDGWETNQNFIHILNCKNDGGTLT